MRALVRLLTVTALVATGLLLPTTGATPASTASAADLRFFDPANIISDAVFFDALSIDVGTVQAFLNVKGATCVPGEMSCLKNYSQVTADQTGDAYCATYRGAPSGESGASIIVKVGQACGINPRVLLVLLQKEQGLITGTRPTERAYTKATGFACPDTSPCNPAFSGFASQVYFAARQFQRYAAGVAGSYKAGKTNTVRYSPDVNCGSSPVFIQNKATAGLYSYTPYQPNAAALSAGYGTGDACSAYGNRNFWNYFTDWFGSTQSTGGGVLYSYWSDNGGAGGRLGSPLTSFVCGIRDGGCYQHFQYGSVYWSPVTGVHGTFGEIRNKWSALGWEIGLLGLPASEEICGLAGGGCYQSYQGGSLYWSGATGAHVVRGSVRDLWGAMGGQDSWLGYPTTDEICGLAGGGCLNYFQNGTILWSAGTGAHSVTTAIMSTWQETGWDGGVARYGYPLNNVICGLAAGGCGQTFTNGTLFWSPATGAKVVRGAVRDLWGAMGAQDSWLGYPTSDEICGLAGGGCLNYFQNGTIIWSPTTGVHSLTADMMSKWQETGWDGGVARYGYPLNNVTCALTAGGCGQTFTNGSIFWSSATGAHVVRGAIRDLWGANGAEAGWLGYPTTDEVCGLRNGGCSTTFQGGSVFWSPATGAHVVAGSMRDAWAAQGWELSSWGYPVTDTRCGLTGGGCTQDFQSGSVYSSPVTGGYAMGSVFQAAYAAAGGETGALGPPTGPQLCGYPRGGCRQDFSTGAISWSSATGTHVLAGNRSIYWGYTGHEWGTLGYPISDADCSLPDNGCGQVFEKGAIYESDRTLPTIVPSGYLEAWAAIGGVRGRLGYPTAAVWCNPRPDTAFCEQAFQGGSIYQTPAGYSYWFPS